MPTRRHIVSSPDDVPVREPVREPQCPWEIYSSSLASSFAHLSVVSRTQLVFLSGDHLIN